MWWDWHMGCDAPRPLVSGFWMDANGFHPSPLPSRERGSAGMIGGMPRPFVPGFWVPAPVSGYGAGPAGMTWEYAGV